MAKVIADGRDLHSESAKAALNLTREPTDEERQIAKILNFSIVYGGGIPTLTEQFQALADEGKLSHAPDKSELRLILSNYHDAWPGIGRAEWTINGSKFPIGTLNWHLGQTLNKRGYLKTLYGRHLHLGPYDGEHKLLNKVVQGSAADLMRGSIVRVHQWLEQHGMVSHLVNTVHDEIILDCVDHEVPFIAQALPVLMDEPKVSAIVPIEIDLEFSPTSWADKEAYVGG